MGPVGENAFSPRPGPYELRHVSTRSAPPPSSKTTSELRYPPLVRLLLAVLWLTSVASALSLSIALLPFAWQRLPQYLGA